VALFATLIPNSDAGGKELGIELFDVSTKKPTTDTTYYVKLIKDSKMIFDGTFQRKNVGLLIDLIPNSNKEITLEETSDVSEFEKSLGIDKKITAYSPVFSKGGLYLFEVKILTLNDFNKTLRTPIVYEFGLSFPFQKTLSLDDNVLGTNQVKLISFYDEIDDFTFDSENKTFSFVMPFDWKDETINQTKVVHEEFIIPKDFSYLRNANFSAYVNDIKLDDKMITIDDYTIEDRIVHLVINQKDLVKLQNKVNTKSATMNFLLEPIFDSSLVIPTWIKNNAKWWSQGQIEDSEFENGIEFLIQKNIIILDTLPETRNDPNEKIPDWIKINAGWWADNQISDKNFALGLKFLVENGIIKV
jgi:hypothetical protein